MSNQPTGGRHSIGCDGIRGRTTADAPKVGGQMEVGLYPLSPTWIAAMKKIGSDSQALCIGICGRLTDW